MKRIGVFVDISNLYYCTRAKFKGRRVNYREFIDYVKELGDVHQATAYGAQIGDEAKDFIASLKNFGFSVKYKEPKSYPANTSTGIRRKADWDVGITIDVVDMADRLDIIVLGTADGDFQPLVEWLVRKGIQVIILACKISKDLRDTATEYIEIPESMVVHRSRPRVKHLDNVRGDDSNSGSS